MEDDDRTRTLYLHLHKLSVSALKSSDALERTLTTLWNTRKTGLNPSQKSQILSWLNLPSPSQLDPVVACLRSLIRKSVRGSFDAKNILKLLPPDLSLDLQGILMSLFQKYNSQWKESLSREQVGTIVPSLETLSRSNVAPTLCPRQDDYIALVSRSDCRPSTPLVASNNVSHLVPLPIQRDASILENLGIVPLLKSMTWTMEKPKWASANRVAVISLKLDNFGKCPSGETEVKFQLTKDTLEAMLRSMSYVNDQLASIVEPSSGPLQKKQRQ